MSRLFALAAALVLVAAAAAVAAGGAATETVEITDPATKAKASCARGSNAVAGGFKAEATTSEPEIAKRSLRKRSRAWEAGVEVLSDPVGSLTTYAYCAAESVSTRTRTRPVADSLDLTDSVNVVVRCPRGKTPVSGGFSGPLEGSPYPSASRRKGNRRWIATFIAYDPGAEGTTQVNCYDGPPLDAVAKTTTIPASDEYGRFVVTAKCDEGETALSGGFRSSTPITEGGPLIFMSRRKAGRKWAVGFFQGFYDVPNKFTTYAYCA